MVYSFDFDYFFDQINASLQVETKVHHLPLNALFLVLLLLQHEHKMVEKLLKSFVRKVNAKLFKTIIVKHFKASNVEHTNEIRSLDGLNVKSDVYSLD